MRWERIPVASRVVAGLLALAIFLVAAASMVAFLERGDAALLDRAFIALFISGTGGVALAFAAISGRSPDFAALFSEINSRR